MANLFSGLAEGFQAGRNNRRQKQQDELDNALKYAQLSEAGYQVTPGTGGGLFGGGAPTTITRDPNMVGLKQLERQKLQNELDPNYEAQKAAAKETAVLNARKTFGSGAGGAAGGPNTTDTFIMDPSGNYHENPYTKPLSDTSASKLSAAEQALGNIQTARQMATPQKFGEMKSGFSKIRLGNSLGITNPESKFGNAVNFMTGGLAKLPFKTTDEQKQFENNLSTLVEGQLRARTGAAAPQQEVDREVSRILASDDSLQSFLNKLSNAEKFTIGIAEGIRPGSSKRFGAGAQQRSEQGAVPTWVPQNLADFYSQEKQLGTSDEEILASFRKRGLTQ